MRLEEGPEVTLVDVRGAEKARHCLRITTLVMTGETEHQRGGPADAALEKSEAQLRKSTRYATEVEAAAARRHRVGEVTDMIEHEVRGRTTVGPVPRAAMVRDGDPEIRTRLPQ